MKIFTISDLHLDYAQNRQWLDAIDPVAYQDDVLIMPGDISSRLDLIEACFKQLAAKFGTVFFVPGNHDLWIDRKAANGPADSLEKFEHIQSLAHAHGLRTTPALLNGVAIVPLLGWYDFSFGAPSELLREAWVDFRACIWPGLINMQAVADHFHAMNPAPCPQMLAQAEHTITFSHFLPRIDVMPEQIPAKHRIVYPVLGSHQLDAQLRAHRPNVHVYGHSHVNRDVERDGIRYRNAALGYPAESHITTRTLVRLW